ncbi:MAG: adenylyl-sulfate kinase [Myxococcota bacterium]
MSATLWLTGLPCAGKTTLARALEQALRARGETVVVLDGDEVRQTLSADLGFDEASRRENVRRCAAVAQLVTAAGAWTIVALVSPQRDARDEARRLHERSGLRFVEVHLAAPLALCEARDSKGLYARGRAGQAKDVTGLDAPYEAPLSPEVRLAPELTVDAAATLVLTAIG